MMEELIHGIAVVMKVGLVGVILAIGGVYLAYGVESDCWNPVGCKNTSAEAKQMAESADLVSKWNRGGQ